MYDRQKGAIIRDKYLAKDGDRRVHSQRVGDLCYKIATKILDIHPEYTFINPELAGFLGHVHDIGYSLVDYQHEIMTVHILRDWEGIPDKIARMTMHGQLYAALRGKVRDLDPYILMGWEGMILNYADMSVWTGEPISLEKRASNIISKIKGNPVLSKSRKGVICYYLGIAMRDFLRLEAIILKSAKVRSVKDLNRYTIIY
jgi:hypothetical protein